MDVIKKRHVISIWTYIYRISSAREYLFTVEAVPV